MKLFLVALVLYPLLALSAWSQTSPQQALSQVQQYLSLTDSQVNAILQNNNDYNNFASQQQRQILDAQTQIAIEISKDSLDPTTIGNLYAGIETTCRGLRDKASTSRQQNISVLTDAQKLKLNALIEAMKLMPTISEAEFGNLIGSVGSPPYSFDTGSTFTFSSPGYYSGVSGCGVAGGFEVLGGSLKTSIPPSTQPGVVGLSTTPVPGNTTVNKLSGDFGPGSLPQTKTQ